MSLGTKNLFIPGNTCISLQGDAACSIAQMLLMQLGARTLRPKWTPHRHPEVVALRNYPISQIPWWLQAVALTLETTGFKF